MPYPSPILSPWLDVVGLTVFAASGALAGVRLRVDVVGVCFFAVVTAVGGGTLRDLLIGAPVFWMRDSTPIFLCLAVALASWVVPKRWWPERALEWLDAAGLAAYAVFGAAKALEFGISPLPAATMGVVTACAGGVIRDIAAGVPSILLRPELYISAAVLAAGLFVAMSAFGVAAPWPAACGAAAGFALRGAAIRWGLTLRPHRG